MFLDERIIEMVKTGGVGVMPTDTIYGVVASVNFPGSLERIYEVKGRPENKQMIHLIGSVSQLAILGIHLNELQLESIRKVWPAPVSIIFNSDDTLPSSHGGTFTIAVRMPKDNWLRDFVIKTGPIVATSANKSGQPTPKNISEIKYQLPGLDFYVDGTVGDTPSKLAKIDEGGYLEYLKRN